MVWDEQERREFVLNARIFFGLAGASYILHYYTVDRGEGLAPSDLWFNYRYGMATVAFSCLALYCTNWVMSAKLFKLPILIACSLFCYFQTMTIIWYPKVPYLYSFAFIFISCLIIRSTVLKTLIFGTFLSFLIWDPLMRAGQSPSMMFSAAVVTQIFVVYFKSKYLSDIRLFLANQKNIEAQRKIIEINMEFTNQVKAFLPSEISKRLIHYIKDQRMSVIQAIDEVLRPRSTEIACIFSDIRGFTKGVNDLPGFVNNSLLPNLKATTQAVETFKGIPRKIGDLLFAYYDSANAKENILNSIRTAFEISNINKELNQDLPVELRINRYILVSCGEAMVGNLSGYDSGIEITAIGKPVNLLSRIDEATKDAKFRQNLNEGDVVLTPYLAKAVLEILPELDLSLLSLESINVKIRDFDEVNELFLLPITKKNYQLLFADFKKENAEGVAA